MKKYIKPQFTICEFDFEDILSMSSASTIPNAQGNFLSGWVNNFFPSAISGSEEFKHSWFLGE